jgi:hypothetical protein
VEDGREEDDVEGERIGRNLADKVTQRRLGKGIGKGKDCPREARGLKPKRAPNRNTTRRNHPPCFRTFHLRAMRETGIDQGGVTVIAIPTITPAGDARE